MNFVEVVLFVDWMRVIRMEFLFYVCVLFNRFVVCIVDVVWVIVKGRDLLWIEWELWSIGDIMMVSCFECFVIVLGYELIL